MIAASESDRHDQAVIASWDRCQYQYNLARDASYSILRLQSTEVAPRLEAMVERTGGRRGIFRQLAEVALKVGHCLVLSDTDQILVRLESKNKGHSEFERYGIALGSCWNERIAGTNGVTMALSQGETFTVRGKDHFFSKLYPFACTAVPLFDARNEMIGAVNLSTIDRGNPAEYLFAQQLLEQAARQIQRILFEQDFSDALILSISDPGTNGLLAKDELIAVDGSGIICGATRRARQLPNGKNTINLEGQPVEAIVGFTVDDLTREPGKVLRMRFDTGTLLNVSVQETKPVRYPGRGWCNGDLQQRRGSIRRRLAPSLRELSVGSRLMVGILEQAQVCFHEGIPFLLEGESGTGKTELVKALHTAAGNSSSHLVTIDCAALADSSKDEPDISSLLQHAHIAQALQGIGNTSVTLVLENIGEMPGYGQTRLRSLLETIESDEQIKDDRQEGSPLRVVATTRQDLRAAVRDGFFREDLYYLLCGARFVLPPLRQREGRVTLARAIAAHLAGTAIELTDESIDAIQRYDWPGNVRELRNALRQSLIAGNSERISLIDLSQFATLDSEPVHRNRYPSCSRPPIKLYDEKTTLMDALLGANWNVTRAARNLGISRATMHRKMQQYSITRPAKGA